MTELDTLIRAKIYMEKLAAGIDPITGTTVPAGELICNPRLSRCFRYVSVVLDGAIAQERKRIAKNLPAFHMAPENIARLRPLDHPVRISELAEHISAHSFETNMRKLSGLTITNYLASLGLLEAREGGKYPTEQGIKLGIFTERRSSQAGEYTAVLYAPAAQQFILDKLPVILEEQARRSEARK